jgi:hypothetical protein
MKHPVDPRLTATPPAVLERNRILAAALESEAIPDPEHVATPEGYKPVVQVAGRAAGGSASDPGLDMDGSEVYQNSRRAKESYPPQHTKGNVEHRPQPAPERKSLYELIKDQVDAMAEFDVIVEMTDADFVLHAASVSIQEYSVSMILKEDKTELKPKFGHTYTLRVMGKVLEVVFAGGFLKDPKLPFTVLSFIINKDA